MRSVKSPLILKGTNAPKKKKKKALTLERLTPFSSKSRAATARTSPTARAVQAMPTSVASWSKASAEPPATSTIRQRPTSTAAQMVNVESPYPTGPSRRLRERMRFSAPTLPAIWESLALQEHPDENCQFVISRGAGFMNRVWRIKAERAGKKVICCKPRTGEK